VGEKVVAGHIGAVNLRRRGELRLLTQLTDSAPGAFGVDQGNYLTLETAVA